MQLLISLFGIKVVADLGRDIENDMLDGEVSVTSRARELRLISSIHRKHAEHQIRRRAAQALSFKETVRRLTCM